MTNDDRSWIAAMARGLVGKCPACGQGRLFKSYLKVNDTCRECGEDLYHHRADDAPPYFTMMIVAHVVVPSMIIIERIWQPAIALQLAFWLPATALLTLFTLPAVKGAIVGLQWALQMHGFQIMQPDLPKP